MSQSIRAAVQANKLSPETGAEVANQMRNEIMQMQRLRDMDLGRALAQQMKGKGVSLEESIARAMKKLNIEGQPLKDLSGTQQRALLMEVIESSGRSRPAVTEAIPRFRWAARGLWLATFAIAAYNIGTAENPWWQTGRESANIAGGLGGSILGGAAMGAAGGVWAGPVGIAVGVVVGGLLGALLADRAYVEAAGASNSLTRGFVGRFTSFWTGLDVDKMARALVVEHGNDLSFVCRVFLSLDHDYNSDADDVALRYVTLVRRDPRLAAAVQSNVALRLVLIKVMAEGWTTAEEAQAIRYLQGR
jgi:hypothetical protein